MPRYADIVLPLAQPAYTFAVPDDMPLAAGQAVAVQFGPRKIYTGIVWRIHDRRPDVKRIKSVRRILYGGMPLVSAPRRALWEWIASYYMCSPGEVMRVALPTMVKAKGDTEEEFDEGIFRPRREVYYSLSAGLRDPQRLHEAFEKIERRAPRQYAALLEVASACCGAATREGVAAGTVGQAGVSTACFGGAMPGNGEEAGPTAEAGIETAAEAAEPCSGRETVLFGDDGSEELPIVAKEVPRRLLAAEAATLHALCRKGWLCAVERERTAERSAAAAFRLPELTPAQQAACEALRAQYAAGKNTALLHGVTGSGKTEIYIHLIAETLSQGGDALLLLPEIALTAQLIDRMERIFGSRVTAYHSRLTDRQRTETYLRLCRSEGGELVVGVRSSLFLPLGNLRLIVVDEEHDASYKQADPAPRYNARDCAVFMARLTGCRTLLGSATPSLETWLNAESGKYGRAVLAERYGDARPPQIILSDTLRAAKRGERKGHFNRALLDRIDAALERGEQVMLFQNRRGFSPYVACGECGWTARCPHCNVTLTYHKAGGKLVCHYCGHTEEVPAKCPSCKVTDVVPRGFGTEKIEEQIAELFPAARVARLDRDSITSERAFRAIVADFEQRRTDILVGTQMIAKGFDFGGVSLVGILNADNLLNNPDFRAAERAFQLMTQVAGRAGRRDAGGEVVVQTSDPGHPVIRQVAAGDFEGMARMQLAERAAFFYPPYGRLVALTLRHRDPALLRRGIDHLALRLRARFGRRVAGPTTPPVDRIRGEYLAGLLLKVESGASTAHAREILRAELAAFAAHPDFKPITVVCNVDPQ